MTELLINGIRYIGGVRRGQGAGRQGPGRDVRPIRPVPGQVRRTVPLRRRQRLRLPLTPDPGALIRALKSAKATITENPNGTLHFAYGATQKMGSTSATGDVTLDGDGRIAKVALTTTWQTTRRAGSTRARPPRRSNCPTTASR